MNSKTDWSRRAFLQMIGAAVPTVTVAVNDPIARLNAVGDASADTSSTKCTPLDLKRYFTASSEDFGPRARARELGRGSEHDGYIRTPGGAQVFRGIPFLLGSEDAEAKSWIVLTTRPTSWAKSSIEIPLEQKADFVCLAGFCDWDENETQAARARRPALSRSVSADHRPARPATEASPEHVAIVTLRTSEVPAMKVSTRVRPIIFPAYMAVVTLTVMGSALAQSDAGARQDMVCAYLQKS
ncbi:MAG: hypothetical protein DMG25_00065, partial [Acidobacteria bacterium]